MSTIFNSFTTTNSTYGNFYENFKQKVKEDQERRRRLCEEYHKNMSSYFNDNYQTNTLRNNFDNYNNDNNKNYHYNNSNFNNINNNIRTKTPNLLPNDPSVVENIFSSLTGLINLGNTCYINSCIQNLIHCPPFIYKFLEVCNIIFQKKIRETPISKAFYELLTQIYENNNREDYLNPVNFVENITSLHKQFYGNKEHDTQEFCRFLLQDFNYELNEVVSPSSYKKELEKNRNKKQMFLNYLDDCLSKENSIITDTFIGYFSFEYDCDCGFKEFSFSQFLDLPVQMNSNSSRYDLFQMIQESFCRKSYVDMGENCSFCNRTSKKYEMMKIALLPQILIISLQRINPYSGTKNDSPVKFYEGMDLRDIVDTEISDITYTKYNLFAVTNHVGKINTGHYFSYIKIGKNWYCFEDSKVYKVGYQIDMTSKEAYTFFYIKTNIK